MFNFILWGKKQKSRESYREDPCPRDLDQRLQHVATLSGVVAVCECVAHKAPSVLRDIEMCCTTGSHLLDLGWGHLCDQRAGKWGTRWAVSSACSTSAASP